MPDPSICILCSKMLLHTTNHCFYFSESAPTLQPCPCPVVSPLPAHERCTAYLPWESTSCSSQCTPILLPVLRILQLVNTDASCGGRHDAAVAGPYVRPEVLQAMMDKAYGNWQAPGAQQPSFGVGVPAAGFRHNRYTGPRWGAGGNSARRNEW